MTRSKRWLHVSYGFSGSAPAGVLVLAVALALGPALGGCGGGGKGQTALQELQTGIRNDGTPWAQRLDRARRASVLAPWEPYWPYAAGSLYVEADSLARAESSLRAALDVDPAYGPALSRLSEIYYRENRHQEAVDLLETARAAHPEIPPELLADLVLHQEALGHPEAARNLMQGLKGTPQETEVETFVLLRGDDFAAAVAPAEQQLAAAPENAVHQNNYGITRLHAGDPVGAKKAFLTAVSLDPFLPGPLYNLALTERFYFMDDAAGRQWFDRYWDLSQADPDGLHDVFYPPADTATASPEAATAPTEPAASAAAPESTATPPQEDRP